MVPTKPLAGRGAAGLALVALASLLCAPGALAGRRLAQVFCMDLYDPVCFEDGTMAGSNGCYAASDPSNEGKEFRREWCGQSSQKNEEHIVVDDTQIVCTMQYDPVCYEDGKVAGSNDCVARTNPANEGKEYRKEWCNQPEPEPVVNASPPPEEVEQVFCIEIYAPVCFENGTVAGVNECYAANDPLTKGNEFRAEWCSQVEEEEEAGPADCEALGGNCIACLSASCVYQGDGSCLASCLIQDISCYTGPPERCPKPEATCSALAGCGDCAAAGCFFQDGACKPECEFGPLGDFLAICYSNNNDCPIEGSR